MKSLILKFTLVFQFVFAQTFLYPSIGLSVADDDLTKDEANVPIEYIVKTSKGNVHYFDFNTESDGKLNKERILDIESDIIIYANGSIPLGERGEGGSSGAGNGSGGRVGDVTFDTATRWGVGHGNMLNEGEISKNICAQNSCSGLSSRDMDRLNEAIYHTEGAVYRNKLKESQEQVDRYTGDHDSAVNNNANPLQKIDGQLASWGSGTAYSGAADSGVDDKIKALNDLLNNALKNDPDGTKDRERKERHHAYEKAKESQKSDKPFNDKVNDIRDSLNKTDPQTPQGKTAKHIGLKSADEAIASHEAGEHEEAEFYKDLALSMAGIAMGFIPGVGAGRDAYEALAGKDLLTGEELSFTARSFAIAGVVSGGVLGNLKNLSKLGKILNKVAARPIADKLAEFSGNVLESAAKLFGKAAPEEVKNFAKLTTEIAGNGVNAIKEIEKIAESAGRTGKGLPLLFDADNAVSHFKDHSDQIMKVFNKSSYNLKEYMLDANHVVKTGQYSKELNAYVKVIGGSGDAKAAFVGLKNGGENISTFHIKDARWISKKDPSLGWSF